MNTMKIRKIEETQKGYIGLFVKAQYLRYSKRPPFLVGKIYGKTLPVKSYK